jgi:cell fate regulator YaaT (PSP1 superfamily)
MDSLIIIRYGILKNIGNFTTKISTLRKGDEVIIRTSRGVEFGEVVSLEQEESGESGSISLGEVLSKVTEEDKKKQQEIEEEIVPSEYRFCKEKIKEHKLPMKLAKVEHLFGSKKIIFYFLAKGRIDFRELVKDLAREYKTRIELKQIGVRDEARLLAEYQQCGRELCCRTFLKDLDPVTMRMAKNQKMTLDPSKISGRCGRLMCCLRYEDQTYVDLKKQLPRRGTSIKTSKGEGIVVDFDVLQQKVTMETTDKKLTVVSQSEILEQKSRKRTNVKKECNTNCENGCG